MYLMCRLCFEDEGKLEKIFEMEETLISAVNNLLFKITDIEGWPTGICESCKLKLIITKDFFKVCHKTQETLLEQMRETTIAGNNEYLLELNSSSEHSKEISQELDSTVSFNGSSTFPQIPSDQESLLEELIPSSEKGAPAENIWSCTECERTFNHKAGLVIHMRRMHSKKNLEDAFHCTECERTFKYKAGLVIHMRMHFNKNSKNTAVPAQSKWDDDASEKNGQLTDETEHPFQCTICEKTFKHKGNLGNHMRSHSITPSVKKKRTLNQSLYSDTEASNEELPAPKVNTFSCKVCGKTFKFKRNLEDHMYIHAEKTVDDEASVEYNSPVGTIENDVASVDKPFQCTDCDRRFMYKAGLVIHQRSLVCKTPERPAKSKLVDYPETDVSDGDEPEAPFQCAECHKTFTYKARYLTHMRVHEENRLENREKQMKLTIYYDAEASQFKSKSHDENKETPTNDQLPEKPFHCKVCGKAFIYRARFTSHMEIHRETTPENQISSKRQRDSDVDASDESDALTTPKSKKNMQTVFECTICNKVLKSRDTLKNHMVIHSEVRPFKCDICGAAFKLFNALHSHKSIHNNICNCTECGQSFNSKSDFHKHRRLTCENAKLLLSGL